MVKASMLTGLKNIAAYFALLLTTQLLFLISEVKRVILVLFLVILFF